MSALRQGIESRTIASGEERFRAYVKDRATGRKVRGRWRRNLAEARSDRVRLLAVNERGGGVVRVNTPPGSPTVAQAVDAFLAEAHAGVPLARGGRAYSARSLEVYAQDFRLRIVPALGDVEVHALRRSQVQALVDEVAVLQSGQVARMVAGALGALWGYLARRYDDLPEPVARLRLPAGSPTRSRLIPPDELRARVDAPGKVGDRAFVAVAAFAGLRRAELVGLRAGDARLEDSHPGGRKGGPVGVLRVRASKTAAGERDAPVFPVLVPYLEAALAALGPDAGPDALLLPRTGRNGRYVGAGLPLAVDQAWDRVRASWRKAGLDDALTPHDLRHACATNLVVAGHDVATVAAWLGHERASTTLDVYVRPLGASVSREAVAALLAGD